MAKKSKKAAPKAKAKKAAPKGRKAGGELKDDAVDRVAGGASDIFVKLGDIQGESTDTKPPPLYYVYRPL
jgi:hypothetical protein